MDENEFEGMHEAYEDFVRAVQTRNQDQAEKYRELLEDHDIPVVVDESATRRGRGMARGICLLVPEPLLDEASEIIADFEREEGLLDQEETFEDEQEDELEGEGFEELDEEGEPFELDDDEQEDEFDFDEEEDDCDEDEEDRDF
ncbi:MAG: hypothetical protein ACOC93_03025 [Planctomycetota bacterium]